MSLKGDSHRQDKCVEGSFLYWDDELLRVFSSTLSYWSYYWEQLPLLLHGALVFARKEPNSQLRVLDVGCGGGELSIPVFDALASDFCRIQLTGIDPGENNIRNFRLRHERQQAKFLLGGIECKKFQDLEEGEKFDLVFCSHSLYEVFETAGNYSSSAVRVVEKLFRLLGPDGICCVILASGNSRAYEFKRQAYGVLGCADRFFMTAEHFRDLLKQSGKPFQEEVVDTYVDASTFWSGEPNHREDCLKWLSYFLRVNCFAIPTESQDRLINLFQDFSLPFGSLPEQFKSYCRKYPAACGPPSDRTPTVFHKESVFVGRQEYATTP